MKKKIVLLLISITLLCFSKSFAQVDLQCPINSNEIIEQGIQCHDRESYDSALVFYRQVEINDPNYSWACYECGLTLYSQNHLDEAESKTREAISHGFSNPALYTLLGSILDDEGKSKEGAAIIQSVYSKWPFNQNLLYNLGICYLNAGMLKESEAALVKAARYFPYHTRTHLALGKVNLYMGHTAEAYLAYNMATLMSPQSNYISEFEDAITGKYSDKINYVDYPYPPQVNAEKWNELRWLLQSEFAISKSFNFPFKLDYIATRQSYLLFQKAIYDPTDTSIYNQFYLRFFKDVINSNNFENYIYYQFQNTGIAAVTQWNEKNKSALNKFVTWSINHIGTWRGHGFEQDHASPNNFTVNFTSNGNITTIGSYLPGSDSLKTGSWLQINSAGCIIERGNYKNGEIEGNYKIYYGDGSIKQDLNFVAGKLDGNATIYFMDGTRSGDYHFENDNRNGICTYYNSSGLVDEHNEYIQGKLNGISKKYDYSDCIITTSQNKTGNAEGPADQTWMNGTLSEKYSFTNDSLSGPYKAFYKNGVTKAEGNHNEGNQVGTWNYYFANEKLKATGNYNNMGERTGVWHYYSFNGVLETIEDSYNDGQLNGTRTEYFPNGKKKEIYTYKDNVLKSETVFDLAGNVIMKDDSTSESFVDKDYFANGVLQLEGGIKNGKRNGVWRFYNPNGILTGENTYVDDDQSGPQKTYYSNGKINTVYYCDSNKTNGLYKEYYKDGQLKSQSWFINNLQQGRYYNYYKNGKIHSTGYLDASKNVGTINYFYSNGNPDMDQVYNDDNILVAIKQYDSNGNVLDSATLPNGNGKYTQHYENGQLQSIATYVMGRLNDSLTIYYPNGKEMGKWFYIFGKFDGYVKRWDTNGSISMEKNYKMGNDEGVYRSYNDGKLYYEANYLNDEPNGMTKIYHTNGKVYKDYEWQNGDRTGYSSYYSFEGILMYRLKYLEGAIIAVSYLGKDGKMVKDIPVDSYSGMIVTYFQSGVISARINFKNGMINGMRTEYYASGAKFRETQFLLNDYHGSDKIFFANGAISEQREYDYDEQTNGYKSFYQNGKVKEESTYNLGDLEGWSRTYDSTGKLTQEARYIDGAMVELKSVK